jgi:PKD repeat protein
MKRTKTLYVIVILLMLSLYSFSQGVNQPFTLPPGLSTQTIEIGQTFTETREISPFGNDIQNIFGMSVNAGITLENDKSMVKIVLIDSNYEEYLIYESYFLLEAGQAIRVDNLCEETCILDAVSPNALRIEITDASVDLTSLTLAETVPPGIDMQRMKRERKLAQNEEKIKRINGNINAKRLHWVAGPTSVSELSYAEKKLLFGQSTFPPGFEFYSGGVIRAGDISLKSATTSMMTDMWDWRDRHGKDWVTPVTDQKSCGSCWAFAATGATEALVNLFYNQILNLDLSEQDVLSCSGAGSCGGGYPYIALNYITNNGIVDEDAFPYTATDQSCSNKGTNPSQLIKIGGRIDLGSSLFPRSEDGIKKAIIDYGPLSGGLYDWNHAMVLAGYQVVKEGDRFYYRSPTGSRSWKTVYAGDPLIGKTVWIFKNSWGTVFGDAGYVYVETDISNFGWTHALKTPVQSLVQNYTVECVDNDGDGYFWWGLGPKPIGCNCPDDPDGDDSDPNLGPLDDYGNCIVLNNGLPPVADLSVSDNKITEGGSVTFSDLSANYPDSRLWLFEGGTPETSSLKNPVVTYNSAGTFDVTLIASNSNGSDTLYIPDLISVEEYVPVYCESRGSANEEWIAAVTIGSQSFTSGSSNAAGYQDFTSKVFSLERGSSYNITLEPGFNPRNKFEYWSVWIDLNGDMDFDDPGEQLFTASKNRSSVTGTLYVPDGLPVDTRMRISMSRNGVPSPCAVFDGGEVEDYSVCLTEALPELPVAEFTASPLIITPGEAVNFVDLSAGNPASWEWTFTGGDPSFSTLQNPEVYYNSPGTYGVSLTVSNPSGSDNVVKQDYITVTEEVVPDTYCVPVAVNSSSDWISKVEIGAALLNNSFGSGYSLFPSTIDLTPGQTYAVSLAPFNAQNKNFWRLWIDFNSDGDFNDSDETLVVGNNIKGELSASITIPSYAKGFTRMRVMMRTGNAPSSCDDNFSGEVEDYNVSFSGPVSVFKSGNTGGPVTTIDPGCKIYPNPATKTLYLQIDEVGEGDYLKIYNSPGQMICSEKISSTVTPINVENLVSGLYYISVITNGRVWQGKFVKTEKRD